MARKPRTDRKPGENELISAFGGHPLEFHLEAYRTAAGVESAGPAGVLADLDVTDAEQLVALSAMPEIRDRLAEAVGLEKAAFDSFVDEARKVLSPLMLAELETPVLPYSLGAIEPPVDEVVAEADIPDDLASAASASSAVNLIGRMPSIRPTQGQRGTCVAFALTSIHDYYRGQNGVANPDWSEQHLYHEMKLIDGMPGQCGTRQSAGATVLASRGQCRNVTWSYNPNLPCNNNGTIPAAARPEALRYRLSLLQLSRNNVGQIKGALSTQRPVAISMPVFPSLRSQATRMTGRITMPLPGESQTGGHAVCLVGFQDSATTPGGGYFILRNSWGTGWGYQSPYGPGHGTIPYKYIGSLNWEAYTLPRAGVSGSEDISESFGERTLTIKSKGNVNLVIE